MTKEEAITNLKQCGILNENEQINEAYKDILIKTDIKNTNKTKLTEEQIIKAMQCVIGNNVSCSECEYQKVLPFPSCRRMCAEQALDLINRKNAEIERLQNRNKFLEIEYKNQGNLFWARVQTSNLEAIKDFAERLKEIIYTHSNRVDVDGVVLLTRVDNIIDNLAKEMMEEEK